jgi:hypothetical protein
VSTEHVLSSLQLPPIGLKSLLPEYKFQSFPAKVSQQFEEIRLCQINFSGKK